MAQTTFTKFHASRHMFSGIQLTGQLSADQTSVRILRNTSNDRASATTISPVLPLSAPDTRFFRWQDPAASANLEYHYWVQALGSTGTVTAEAGPVVGKRPLDTVDLSKWEQVVPTMSADFGNFRLRLLNHSGYIYLFGGDNSVRRSSDGGTTWQNFTTGASPFHLLVGGDNGVLHALTSANNSYRVWRSNDFGATWAQTPTSNFPGATSGIRELVFGGARWLASGSGVVYTSVNGGVSWTNHGVKIDSSQPFHNIIYAQNRFVACSYLDDGVIHHSTDGNTWTTIDPDPSYKQYLEWVIYTGTEYIAAPSGISPSGISGGNKIYRSTNLTTWTATAITADQARVFSDTRPLLFNGRFYGTRYGKQLVRTANTSNLSNWEIVDDNAYTSIVNTGTRLLAAGQGGFLAESVNGQSWTGITAPTNQNLKQVIRGPGGWVALPETGAPLFSSNGRNWQRVATTPATRQVDWHAAVASDGRYVLYGSYTYVPIYYPTNAQGSTVFTFPLRQHVTETFFVSQNGTTWTEKTNVQDAQGAMRSLDGNLFHVDNAFLAKSRVDGTKLLRSSDGLNWQTITSGYTTETSNLPIQTMFRQGAHVFMSRYKDPEAGGLVPTAFVNRANQFDGTWSQLFRTNFFSSTFLQGGVRPWAGKLWNLYHPNNLASASLLFFSSSDGQTWAPVTYSNATIQPHATPHWSETTRLGAYAFRHSGTATAAASTDVLFVSADQTGEAWYPQTVSTAVAMTSIAGSPDESAVMVAEGGRILFATLPKVAPPSFDSLSASNLGTSAATLNAQVTHDGIVPITERGFVYSPIAMNANPVLGGAGVVSVTSPGTTGVFSVLLNGLSPNTAYAFKAFATTSIGTACSTVAIFTTLASPPEANATATILNASMGTVSLDGSASSDIDGTIVSWSWSWSGGSATGANPTVTLPAGETIVTLTVTDDDGATSSTTLTVNIVTLASAMQASGLTGVNALPNATPHNDGVENLLKYAFNMNLSGSDSRALVSGTGNAGLPAIGLTGTGPATMIRVEFLRRKGSGLIYTPMRSSTLAPGSFVAMSGTPVVTSIDDNWERVVVQESANPATLHKSFAMVEVRLP